MKEKTKHGYRYEHCDFSDDSYVILDNATYISHNHVGPLYILRPAHKIPDHIVMRLKSDFEEYVRNENSYDKIIDLGTLGIVTINDVCYKITMPYGWRCPHQKIFNLPEEPHFNVSLNTDENPYPEFLFTISLVDLLCKDELTIIRQRDEKNNIDINNPSSCSWNGYEKLREGLRDWLFSKCVATYLIVFEQLGIVSLTTLTMTILKDVKNGHLVWVG